MAAETESKIGEQHNYTVYHEINTEDVYVINGEIVTYEDWIRFFEEMEALSDANYQIHIDPDPVTPEPDPTTEPTEPTEPEPVVEPIDPEEPASDIIAGLIDATSAGYIDLMTTVGSEFEYLKVYNGIMSLFDRRYDSCVISVDSVGDPCVNSELVEDDNFILSCVCRSEGINYESYIVDCVDRTAPGDYNGQCGWTNMITNNQKIYYLSNARVEVVNNYTTAGYIQIVISYDHAYTALEYLVNKVHEEEA